MSDEAKWGHLPHDPRTFFGLAETFDRKELKRAYNKLIRQYKPERFPDEFQRIRAAYEMLDGQLRYGQQSSVAFARQEYQWRTEVTEIVPVEQTGSGSASPVEPAFPIHERLKTESPAKLYKELKAQSKKTPYEFFVLALTADVVTDDPTLFFQWLLTGIKAHPDDRGLFGLLYEYFQTELPIKTLPAILLATSKVIRTDKFYFLTEFCWRHLIRNADFNTFKRTLAACESNLKDFRVAGRIVFYVQILRQAVWKGDPAWVDAAFSFVEKNSSELPGQLEMDVEFLETMRDYRQTGQQFADGNQLRKQIHNTIVGYFGNDVQTGDRYVIECQLELVEDANSILRAFPASLKPEDEKSANAMWVLWQMISREVSERNGLEPKRLKSDKFMRRLFNLMEDLDQTWNIKTSHVLAYYALTLSPYVLFALIPILLWWMWLSNLPILIPVALIMGVVLVVVYHLILKPKTIEPIFHKMISNSIRRNYLRLWRGRFVQLLDATQATMGELSNSLFEIVYSRKHNLQAATYLVEFVPQDLGIAFYSEAARFRN